MRIRVFAVVDAPSGGVAATVSPSILSRRRHGSTPRVDSVGCEMTSSSAHDVDDARRSLRVRASGRVVGPLGRRTIGRERRCSRTFDRVRRAVRVWKDSRRGDAGHLQVARRGIAGGVSRTAVAPPSA